LPVDPQLAALLPLIGGGSALAALGVDAARTGFWQLTAGIRDHATLAPVASVQESTYPGAAGPLRARVYRPLGEGPCPTVLFIHGGAFVMGDIETHDDHARRICHDVEAVVVSIDYRLAPEDPFPAGYLDCLAAFRHVVATVGELGGDPTRIAVAGDSAGANLAAGVAVAARDEGLPLHAQLLIYPVTDFHDSDRHQSRIDNGVGYFLVEEDMRLSEKHYGADADDPRASVLDHPDLSGLAPAVVATAEFDPLRDEGIAFADALSAAGVPVVRHTGAGLIHGYFGMGLLSAACATATTDLCRELKDLLG
jgi:acetyl esterase